MSKANESFFSLFLPGSGQNKNNFRSPSSTSIFWPHTAKVRGSKAPEIHILQQFSNQSQHLLVCCELGLHFDGKKFVFPLSEIYLTKLTTG